MSKVIKIESERLLFDDGSVLYSDHSQDCCESHWLDFGALEMSDFEGLEFDLSGEGFFEEVDGYGIRLVPINGHPISVAGYGSNNGYYSSNLDLILTDDKDFTKTYDISECQEWSD